MTRTLGITGASGYIGQAVARRARVSGWRVVALGRRPADFTDDFRSADLSFAFDRNVVHGLDAVLHLAADVTGTTIAPELETSFASSLAKACLDDAIPLLVISSQAASDKAPSAYGRTKAAIERIVLSQGAVVVRPGLVVGGREAGLFGQLVALTRALPVLPMLVPRPLVQPVHVDDLADAMLAALCKPELAGKILCVADDPIHFDALLMQIAHYRLGRQRIRVPVPTLFLRLLLLVAGRLLSPAFSASRLDSLTKLRTMDCADDLRSLSITLRPLAQALDRRTSLRRAFLREARVLMVAVAKWPARGSLMRRYALLLPRLGVAAPLPLKASLLMTPVALAALDTIRSRRSATTGDLSWRMELISRLAEAEPDWADAYLPRQGHSGRLRAMADILVAAMRECRVRIVAPVARYAQRCRL